MKKNLLLAAMATFLIAGCNNQGGEEFVGNWVSVNSAKQTLVIERNGSNFIIRETSPEMFSGKIATQNLPATLKDETLQVQTGMGAIAVAIDKSTGNLTNGRAEYKRVK